MKICEYCGKEFPETESIGPYASGRFCSIVCARGFSTKFKDDNLKTAACVKCGKPTIVKKRTSLRKVVCDGCNPRSSKKSVKRVKKLRKIYTHCCGCGKQLKPFIKNKTRKFCDNYCKSEYYYNEYIKRWKMGIEDGKSGVSGTSKRIRRYLFTKYKSRCALCGWGEINKFSKKIPLHIEHIDGNSENNCEENLLLLCPNCHSLTSTYGNLNRGRGRKYYRDLKRKQSIEFRRSLSNVKIFS